MERRMNTPVGYIFFTSDGSCSMYASIDARAWRATVDGEARWGCAAGDVGAG